MENIKENIEETLTRIALKIAKQNKGCIFVIMNNKFDYTPLIEQDIKPFSVYENQRRTELLASNDGACIISPEGNLIAYAVNILNVKTFTGFGLRHSSSYTASFNGNIVIMSSEEDSKVRIFKDGKYIMQIDAKEKNIENKTKDIVGILESIGAGTIGAVGVGILAPTIGLSIIPGILVFGSAHFAFKYVGQLMSKK
jgi:DNA integrity scanning protein DisA with diadenylate cyclase activity